MSVEDTVLGMWKALSARDWASVKTFLSDDCIYVDMPLGPTLAARGPDDIVKRIKLGPGQLASYVNHDGLLLSNGTDVMYEHTETWGWHSGETALLQFVSVHRVESNKITLWKDYWDFGALMSQAPPTLMDDFGSADTNGVALQATPPKRSAGLGNPTALAEVGRGLPDGLKLVPNLGIGV